MAIPRCLLELDEAERYGDKGHSTSVEPLVNVFKFNLKKKKIVRVESVLLSFSECFESSVNVAKTTRVDNFARSIDLSVREQKLKRVQGNQG